MDSASRGMTPEAIAGWATALATGALAIAAWIQLPLIARQVRGLAEQIRLSREAEINAERRMREWETLKACQQYDFDVVIDQATKRVWNASRKGTDYKNADVDTRDLICVLNYLDGMATGIKQKLYIEEVVRDHLGPVFDHAVVNFVESGRIGRDGLTSLLDIHAKWFKSPAWNGYQSRAAVD